MSLVGSAVTPLFLTGHSLLTFLKNTLNFDILKKYQMSSSSSSASSEWGKIGASYKSLSLIPHCYSKIAAPILFPPAQIASQQSPVTLLDVAGGPGTFVAATCEYFKESSLTFPPQSALTSTDFADGMVQQAQSQLTAIETNTIGNPAISSLVLDACDPHQVPDHHFSHLSCMFGIMFFPKRAEALQRLHTKLIPTTGRAIFASWHIASLMTVCEEFSTLVDPSSAVSFASRSTALDVCNHPNDFAQELSEAGYHNIEITQHHEVFQVDEHALFQMSISNPAIVQAFPAIAVSNGDEETLRTHWLTYLASPHGQTRCVVDETTGKTMVCLEYVANIALALA